MEYNTEREHLKLREYGRNVQRMTEHLLTIEDREKRNSYAATLVHLMKSINPNVKEGPEYEQKVWDDLFIISNFELDAEGPYPKPEANILDRKPDRVAYQKNNIKYRHFGRSVEILMDQAASLEDPSEKESAVIMVGKLMKAFYQTWNKDNIEDEQVLKIMKSMSNEKLDIDIEKVKELGLFDMSRRPGGRDDRRRKPQHGGRNQHQNRGHNKQRGKRRN